MQERHLAQAELHVTEGERIVARQRGIVAELETDGHDAKSARELLALFESAQATLIAHRDRRRAELAGPVLNK